MRVSYPFYASTVFAQTSKNSHRLYAALTIATSLPRQIPYAIGQFTVNEFCHELAFRQLSEEAKREMGPSGRFSIALGSGILAGFAAAVLSHACLFSPPYAPVLTPFTASRYPS